MKSALRIILVFLLVTAGSVSGQVRLKDIARLEGAGPTSLIGYGLVVGLNGTGDRHTSSFTEQSVANMLDRFGITVSQHDLRLRNVAAVMVTAQISPYVRPGSTFDVGVSSIGDASSLAGGALLPTPLSDLDGGVWGHAQGSVSVGGFNIEAGRVAVRKNYTLVGRVPGGGLAERGDSVQFASGDLRFILQRPDFTTAQRAAEALNAQFGSGTAKALDAVSVAVTQPTAFDSLGPVQFISQAEMVTLEVDVPARVVINERTGTVVVGEKVRLRPAAVTHGSISIAVKSAPIISQPNPFGQGQTVVAPLDQLTVEEKQTPLVSLQEGATVGDVATALNSLGVTPSDLIAIFQALKEAGALQGELVII